ncbi:MAG: serine hydrolase domain-containing protein [Bacteroidia bacterium]|nr:serine hydrolase domain-containing protein [Bacteroidia bacterium]
MLRIRSVSASRPLLLLAAILIFTGLHAQRSGALPRSTPEAEGVASPGISAFIDAADAAGIELHSLMMLRNGKVVAEGWWAPYGPELRHTMYSCSKSFTSAAVGFAVQEQRIALSDRVVSFFPDLLPDSLGSHLASMTVGHLLTMSAGQDPEPIREVMMSGPDWVQGFLAVQPVHAPGSRFLYNSLATYMAGAIVQRVTGQTLMEYLQPRLFGPLGIEGADWEVDPLGRNTGGWGLRIRTEDMAKFGQFCLQRGAWNGKQLLDPAWIDAASAAQIIQHPDKPLAERASSDWEQGYGYQFWRCVPGGYRADGAYGQYILIQPELNAVIAITSEVQDMQSVLNLAWKHLLPACRASALPAAPADARALRRRLAALRLPLPAASRSPLEAELNGRMVAAAAAGGRLDSLRLHFSGKQCTAELMHGGTAARISFGRGAWVRGRTERLGVNLLLEAPAHFAGLPPAQTAGAFHWKDPQTLELNLRYIESPHHEVLTLRFGGGAVTGTAFRSDRPRTAAEIRGVLKQAPAAE